jgi:hypothetical protein
MLIRMLMPTAELVAELVLASDWPPLFVPFPKSLFVKRSMNLCQSFELGFQLACSLSYFSPLSSV